MEQPHRLNRLQGLGVASASVLMLGGAFALSDCEGPGNPRLDQGPVTTVTTTIPERTSPWFERYGWDRDWAQQLTEEYIYENMGTRHEFLVAAGRCALSRIYFGDNPEDWYWVISQNPVVYSGEYTGVEFTTFSGFYVRDRELGRQYSIEMLRIVEGDVYWGYLGIIPSQTTVIDQRSRLNPQTGSPILPHEGEEGIVDNDYTLGSEFEGIEVGRIIILPRFRSDLVSRHCLTPAVNPEDPPDSIV